MMGFLNALAPFASLLLFGAQVVFAIILLAMRSKFTPRDEFESLKKDVADLDIRQGKTELKADFMERALAQLPDSDTIHQLTVQMTELKGEIKTMNARFDSMSDIGDRLQSQIDRMDEFLKRRGS